MSHLPSLAQLHEDPQQAFKNDSLKLLLNQPPHDSWLKDHPHAKTKNNLNQTVAAKYLPIDKVEYLLDYIFQQWKIEVLKAEAMFQSISVTVRVHYLNPVTREWMYHDGVGASPVQTDAGKSAADLGAIKSAGVQMALPAAKSYAIKDACEHLGKLFGRDVNRRDTIAFAGAYMNEAPPMTAQAAPAPAAPAPAQAYNPNPQPPAGGYQPLPMNQFPQYAQQVPHPAPHPQHSAPFNPAAL